MKKSILALGAITVLSAPLLSANIPNAFAASSNTKSTTTQVSKGQKTSSAKVDAPKNVILFIGDGMGEASRNAIRLATVGKSGLLEMDNMPVNPTWLAQVQGITWLRILPPLRLPLQQV